MGVIYADVPKALVRKHLRKGEIVPLTYVPPLTEAVLDESVNVVCQMGVEPIQKALAAGCQVVLAGRCYDPAVFASLPIALGFDPGLAIHMGKILECAAIAATPGSGADCAFGTLRADSFVLESLNPARRFTKVSTAAHTLYEKTDPYHLPGPGGELDLTACSFTELPGGKVEVRGSRHVETERYWVKLEGVRRVGYRTIAVAGTRDPIMIREIDGILAGVESQVKDILKAETVEGRIFFHVYGKDGVMGALEPEKQGPRPRARHRHRGRRADPGRGRLGLRPDPLDAPPLRLSRPHLHGRQPGLAFLPLRCQNGRGLRVLGLPPDAGRPAGRFPGPDGRVPRRKGVEMKRSILSAAKVVRSKNSGPYELTLDILFKDRAHFELFRRRNIVTKRKIAALYRRPVADILKIVYFEPSNALKITMRRPIPSGDAGETDIYGAQQHAPLLSLTY